MKFSLKDIFGFNRSWYEEIFFYSFFLMSALVPLVFSFRVKSVFTLPKLYICIALLLIAVCMLVVRLRKDQELTIFRTKFNTLLGVYGGLLLLSTLFSINIYSSLFGMYGRFLGLFTLWGLLLLAFLVCNFIRTRAEQITLLVVSYLTSVVVAILGIAQHYGYFLQDIQLSAVASRAFGTIGHANHFGGYLVQFMCVSGALYILTKNKIARIGILVSNVLFLVALFQTSSRGSFIALIGCTALLILSLLKIYSSQVKKHFKKICAITLLLIVVTTGALFGFKEQVKNIGVVKRTIATIEFMQQGHVPDRLSWIYSSIEMVRDNPLVGTGVSTYQDAYNKYRRLDYRAPGEEQDLIVPHSAHNEYFNIAATQGALALIVYLMLCGVTVHHALKKAFTLAKSQKKSSKKNTIPQDTWVLFFLSLSLFAYLFQVITNFGVVGTLVPFFILLGLTHGYALNLEKKSQILTLSTKNIQVKIGVGVLIIFSVANMYFHHRILKSDVFLRLTDILHTHEDFKEKGYVYHIDAAERAIMHNPYEYRLHEKRGEFYLKQAVKISKAGETEELMGRAIEAYNNALALNDLHPNTYKNLASTYKYLSEVYEQTGTKADVAAARKAASDAYNYAIELSPNNPLYRDLAAKMYLEFGDEASALELYTQIKEIRPEYPEIDTIIENLIPK